MANLINLNAEIGADLIADDAQPAVAFRNTGSGPGLRSYGLVNTSTASVDLLNVPTVEGAPTIRSVVSEGVAALFSRTVVASPTVAVVAIQGASAASTALLELRGTGFVSCTTILFTTGATSGVGAIRVKYGDNYGWVPILPSGSVTAAVAVL